MVDAQDGIVTRVRSWQGQGWRHAEISIQQRKNYRSNGCFVDIKVELYSVLQWLGNTSDDILALHAVLHRLGVGQQELLLLLRFIVMFNCHSQ